LEIIKTIELSDVSGSAVLLAPEIKELLRLIESPQIHGVVAKEFSRLMRPESFTDYALLQAFADTRTVLYLPEGPIDLASKSGRLLGTIRAAIAGLERTEILERIWAAKEEKRKAGKHAQGWIALPYGVGYDKLRGWYYKPEVQKVREAFRLFLAGETSYWAVGRSVGIEPYNLRIILRSPIYTGWRVYSHRRDPSPGARRARSDGRQQDRPKILRSPEEVIRVRVLEPIVSEDEFQRVQQVLELKRQRHWRVRPDYEHRFVYNGFLICGGCGNSMYTHVRKPHDWYVCKSRTTAERLTRETRGLEPCSNPYMRRERIEASIDKLFSELLRERSFLNRVADEYVARSRSSRGQSEALRLEKELRRLEGKRRRVLESYFEHIIDREERDHKLAEICRNANLCREVMLRKHPPPWELSAENLAEVLAPFHEWEFLSRSDKRHLLQGTVPEIHVQQYRVTGISLLAERVRRDEGTRLGRGSSPPPAPAAPGRSG
jgi:DNA invertase Pin-like site-specific DNA recombinase